MSVTAAKQRQRESKASQENERRSPASSAAADRPRPTPWSRSTLALALLGGVLLYAAFPPVNIWPLAWIAPVPWLLLVRAGRMPGKRPYRWLYLAGFLHWLALVQWVRLGHWAAHFGWVALSLYLALFLPLFIWLTRTATGRLRVPLVFAAPAIWVGLECLRGWAFTGVSVALLGHTQIFWLPIVQISDLGGAYAVSFLVMMVAAAAAELIPLPWVFGRETCGTGARAGAPPVDRAKSMRWWPAPLALAAVAAAFCYGEYRIGQSRPPTDRKPARIALIQGSIDTVFGDPGLDRRTLEHYIELTREALREEPDAIFWPESTLPYYLVEFDAKEHVDKGRWLPQDDEAFDELIGRFDRAFHQTAAALGFDPVKQEHVPLLLGATKLRLGDHPPQRLNSAVFVNDRGVVPVDQRGRLAAYDKLHPVMFGEYAPGGKMFPWIYKLMPIPEGLTPGDAPRSFEIAGLQMCPSICYENTVPHLIRRQVADLQSERVDPDVLVTLSNDGWFYGSAELDMHLTCGRFRAIEMRKPALIAANTGISAHIADDGRLLAQGPRRKAQVVMAEVLPAWRSSLYCRWGDVLANTCLLLVAAVAVWGLVDRRQGGPSAGEPSKSDASAGDSSTESA